LDAAVNTGNYSTILGNIDALKQTRSTIYDVGCEEINGSGAVVTHPLDSSLVGAGNPYVFIPPVTPIFTPVAPVCSGGLILLPTTSNNGITGSWSPSINNQATTTYTFTPLAGSNATTTYMTVTVLHPSVNEITVNSNSSYSWHGASYTSSGNYTWTGINAVGCDSVVTLHLTINCPPSYSVDTVTSLGSYTWNGTTYTSSGNYIWTGINSAGCDSIVHLFLTILPGAVVYPNPTSGLVNINLCALDKSLTSDNLNEKNFTVSIYDAQGKIVLRKKIFQLLTNSNEISLKNYSRGIYFIKIQSGDNRIFFTDRILRL
jgi:hypothetical protein